MDFSTLDFTFPHNTNGLAYMGTERDTCFSNNIISNGQLYSTTNLILSLNENNCIGYFGLLWPNLDTYKNYPNDNSGVYNFFSQTCLDSNTEYEFVFPFVSNRTFSDELWKRIEQLLSNNLLESALIELYSSLKNEIIVNIGNCNQFLYDTRTKKVDYLNEDIIIHILNALSVVRNDLDEWINFVSFSSEYLESIVGHDMSVLLLESVI